MPVTFRRASRSSTVTRDCPHSTFRYRARPPLPPHRRDCPRVISEPRARRRVPFPTKKDEKHLSRLFAPRTPGNLHRRSTYRTHPAPGTPGNPRNRDSIRSKVFEEEGVEFEEGEEGLSGESPSFPSPNPTSSSSKTFMNGADGGCGNAAGFALAEVSRRRVPVFIYVCFEMRLCYRVLKKEHLTPTRSPQYGFGRRMLRLNRIAAAPRGPGDYAPGQAHGAVARRCGSHLAAGGDHHESLRTA